MSSRWQSLVLALAIGAFAATVPAGAAYTRSGQSCYRKISMAEDTPSEPKCMRIGCPAAPTTWEFFSTQVLWVPEIIKNHTVSSSEAEQLGYAWEAEAVSKLDIKDAKCKTFHNAPCTTVEGKKFYRIAVGVAGSVTAATPVIQAAVEEFRHKTHQLNAREVLESRDMFAGAGSCSKCTATAPGLCSKDVWSAFLDSATQKPACVTPVPPPPFG